MAVRASNLPTLLISSIAAHFAVAFPCSGPLLQSLAWGLFPVWAGLNTLLAGWRLFTFSYGQECTWNLAQMSMLIELIGTLLAASFVSDCCCFRACVPS
jgi:hypothetical protein